MVRAYWQRIEVVSVYYIISREVSKTDGAPVAGSGQRLVWRFGEWLAWLPPACGA